PDHSCGMKLHVFHVDQRRAGVISERMSVASAIPAIAGNFVCFANPAGRKHDCFGAENSKMPAFAIVTKRPDNSLTILQQCDDADFHVHVDSLMDAVILQGSDHLQTGAVAHVREPGIFMAAEISL